MEDPTSVDRISSTHSVERSKIIFAIHTFLIMPAMCAIAWLFGLPDGGPPGALITNFVLTSFLCIPIHAPCILLPKSKHDHLLGYGIMFGFDAVIVYVWYVMGQALASV